MSENTDTLGDLQLVAESIRAAHLDTAEGKGVKHILQHAKHSPSQQT